MYANSRFENSCLEYSFMGVYKKTRFETFLEKSQRLPTDDFV